MMVVGVHHDDGRYKYLYQHRKQQHPCNHNLRNHHHHHPMILRILVCCLLAVLVLAAGAAAAAAKEPAIPRSLQTSNTTMFDYYDRLRVDSSLVLKLESSSSNTTSSNVFRVTDGQGEEYRLVDISCFLPFSEGQGHREKVENDALALLLAIYHFNNIQKSPILEPEALQQLQGCNVRLTAELFDTEFSPTTTTQRFSNVLMSRTTLNHNSTLEKPLPVAVVGAYRSATTSPLAIVSGVNDIPQVSYASTSTDFDSKSQYPYFGRTVSSTVGEAKVALQYFQNVLHATHVGVIFVTDSYGSSLQKAFQDAASRQGIVTESVGFPFSAADESDIKNAVRTLAKTQFRMIYAICFETHYRPMMETAFDEGMVGGKYLWIFPGLDANTFQRDAVFPPGSPLIEATRGVGLVQFTGGFLPEILAPNGNKVSPLQDPPTSGYEKLRVAWREAVSDPLFTDYVRSKIPQSLTVGGGPSSSSFDLATTPFSQEPNPLGPLVYDAVTALGLSFCSAGNESEFFTGPQVYERFRNQDFQGTSGRVKITPETGTRDYLSITYVIWNVQSFDELNEDGLVQIQLAPTNIFRDGEWNAIPGMPYVYGDGGTTAPESLPPVEVDTNSLGDAGRAVGYATMGVVFFFAIASLVWLIWYRHHHVVYSSQPVFLLMVSVGSLVMASTIIPLSLQEPVSLAGLDKACMAIPWLFFSGLSVIISSLFAKTRGIHLAYVDPTLDCILVTSLDLLRTFALLFSLNFVVLLTWTLYAPLEWSRVFKDSTDIFDRNVESYAVCSNDDAVPFIVVIALINVTFLLLGNWWAFQCRNIETELSENRYTGISLAAMLQAWCMGVPILVVVWDNPPAKYYVQVGMICVATIAVLLLLYVPKVLAVRADLKRRSEEVTADEDSLRTSGHQTQDEDGVRIFSAKEKELRDDQTPVISPEGIGGSEVVDTNVKLKSINDIDESVTGKESSTCPEEAETLSTKLKVPSADDAVKSQSLRGIKVLHNPRSGASLLAGGGRELSRPQLENLHDSADDEDEKQEEAAIGEEDVPSPTSSPSRQKQRSALSGIWKKKSPDIARRKSEGQARRRSSGSLKVLHNPRSEQSLFAGGGRELSRVQLEILQSHSSDDEFVEGESDGEEDSVSGQVDTTQDDDQDQHHAKLKVDTL